MKATLLSRQKIVYPDGSLIETKIWIVPKTSRTPEGFKYSLVYINKKGQRVLGYDNAEGKGHHKHVGAKEMPYDFKSVDELVATFEKEVRELRKIK